MSGREGVGSGEGTLRLKWKVEEVDEEVVLLQILATVDLVCLREDSEQGKRVYG